MKTMTKLCGLLLFLASCGGPTPTPTDEPTPTPTDAPTPTPPPTLVLECVFDGQGEVPNSLPAVGCQDDFGVLAADPLDASIPGAKSLKTVVDRVDGNALYFMNTNRYLIHWEFCFENLSGNGLPIVPELGAFNTVEYYSPDRRFILGAITHYEEPDVWAYELSPYDTATAEMIETAYRATQENSFFGENLVFHATSQAIQAVAENLPADIAQITTEELFAGITYQPLNLATSMGRLSFKTPEDLELASPDFREIVVLEEVPLDISATAGIITQQFQTPLSHINVLSQNRGTPNMGLRGAFDDPVLRGLEDQWVELIVGAFGYTIREVTQAEADAWWDLNRPETIIVEPMDTSDPTITDAVDILDRVTYPHLGDAISAMVPRFGGKGSHYGALSTIGPEVPIPPGFVIPVYWYDKHMTDNDLWPVVDAMLADPEFLGNPIIRKQRLAALRHAIASAPIDPALEAMVVDKLLTGPYSTTRFRFRSSTNAEDVEGFNGAGLYSSNTGDPTDPTRPVRDAMRLTWSSVWSDRAYEERSYYGIIHRDIGMALLCHRSFPIENSNGVAITANIFDSAGIDPAFYINVQVGDEPVVRPDPSITTDQILFYYAQPGQPIVYLASSSLLDEGETVLSNDELNQLSNALEELHLFFGPAYNNGGFYGMDVEFKFDEQFDPAPQLYIKQARPYPGFGLL